MHSHLVSFKMLFLAFFPLFMMNILVVKHTCSELPFLTHGSFSTILQFTVYNKQPVFLQRNSIFFPVPNLLEMEKHCDFVVISPIF